MSSPGPVLSLRGVSKSFGAVCRRFARSASSAEPARCTRSSGRTGPGNRHCWDRERLRRSRPGGDRDRRATPPARLPTEARTLGLGMAYQTYSHVLDLSVAENLYLAAPRSQQPSYGRMEAWAAAKLAEFRARSPGESAYEKALTRQPAVPRGDQGAPGPPESAAPGRADDRVRAGGRGTTARARARAEPRRRRHRLRQPPPAGGARDRRSRHRPPRRGRPGDVRGPRRCPRRAWSH